MISFILLDVVLSVCYLYLLMIMVSHLSTMYICAKSCSNTSNLDCLLLLLLTEVSGPVFSCKALNLMDCISFICMIMHPLHFGLRKHTDEKVIILISLSSDDIVHVCFAHVHLCICRCVHACVCTCVCAYVCACVHMWVWSLHISIILLSRHRKKTNFIFIFLFSHLLDS